MLVEMQNFKLQPITPQIAAKEIKFFNTFIESKTANHHNGPTIKTTTTSRKQWSRQKSF